MKVLIIHNILWSHYKNALFSELDKHCKAKNIDLKVVQMARNEISRASFETDKAYLQANYNYELLFDDFSENIPSKTLFKALLKSIRNFKPDIVNITGFYSWIHLATILFCKLSGIKVILSNDSTRGDNPVVGWKEIVKKSIISLCDGFFCFGTLAVEYMLELGAAKDKILTQRCGVVDNQKISELHQLAQQKPLALKLPKHNFIYVGRFFEHKNLMALLDAFATANITNEWGLMLLGGGVQREELENYIKNKAIDHVFIIDGKPWYEVPQYLALADVLVLPSKSEPWGLVVNEAMACQMPVIVSDKCGCYPDLVQQNKNGFVFNHQNTEELTSALKFMIENPELMNKMGQNSLKIIESFTTNNAATEMVNGFLKLKKHQ